MAIWIKTHVIPGFRSKIAGIVGCPSPYKFGTSSLRCCHPISRFHHKGHPRFNVLGLKRGDFTTAVLPVRQLTLTTATEGLNTKKMWNHEASHLKHRKESLLVLKHYKFRGNHHFFHVHLQGAAGSNDALLVDPWPIFLGLWVSYILLVPQ
jgi:hypothetical protein